VASSVVALLAALAIMVFILGRGPGTLVWFNGSSPTWLPFAGSGLSWLPFGHQNPQPQPDPGSTPSALVPISSPGPSASTSPSPSADPSPSPSATPSPSPTTTLTPGGQSTPTPTPAPTATPAPTPTPTPTATPAPGPLTGSASASPLQGMAPLTVNFSGSASGGSGTYTYYWDFGDGTMTTGQSVPHVYPQMGTYSAILTVEDSATATATSYLLIDVSLGLTISATPTSGLASLDVALAGSATGGTAPYYYSWDFGDGTTAGPLTAAAQTHTYGTPGTVTAKLTVTDALAATATVSVSINVQQPVPTVGGVSPNAGPESGGTTVTITGTYLMNLSTVKFGNTFVAAADLGVPVCDPSGDCTVDVKSPIRPAGPIDVRVTTTGGTSAIGNSQYTYLLDWNVVAATTPTAREGAAMVNYGGGVLMFGGYGATLLSETWIWDGTGWSQLATLPAATPAARANASIAYTGNKVVLFGGACGLPVATTTCSLNDTWTWDPTTKTWTSVQVDTATPGATQPSRRLGSSLAKDSSQKLLLFGGRDATGYLTDSWTFTGSSWTFRTTAGPSSRAFAAMATDASGQVVLFGGYDGTSILGDTWTWKGTAWSQVSTLATPSPRKLAVISLFYHPNGGTASGLAIFGGRDGSGDLGDTWTWNGYSWTQIYAAGPGNPSVRSDAMAAMDSSGSVIIFGGTSGGTQLNDLWRLA
jgi:PKD repeat protein